MIKYVEQHIAGLLETLGLGDDISLTKPPQIEMGDAAFPVFQYAKEHKMSPVEAAKLLAEKFNAETEDILVKRAEAFGPYVNFFLNERELARIVLNLAVRVKPEVSDTKGTIMVEYACANTHKLFHIGHLRNVLLAESLIQLYEYAGYRVVRANYQGDVGMHIAKCLWGIEKLRDEYDALGNTTVHEKVAFIGKAYAYGATKFEEDVGVQEEVGKYNQMIYEKNPLIQDVYETTRNWSLEYFEHIYQTLGTRFDRYYFESEVFERAVEIVKDGVSNGIFEESQGAVIFKGSDHGLHDRVFINSKGLPTYEAKDVALAEKQFNEFHPDAIYHVIGPEQSEYLKVLFKALEHAVPESMGKEFHIPYGWVDLKGEGKMSSRAGKVVTALDLIEEIKTHIREHMEADEVRAKLSSEEKEVTVEKVAMAALKYAFLKTGRVNNITFDIQESVSTSGDSGPYLLYVVARFKSILEKSALKNKEYNTEHIPEVVENAERALIAQLGEFDAVLEDAIEGRDPSKIAQYQFELSKVANQFYHECPVLTAPEHIQEFRLALIRAVVHTMERGFDLLGIETIEQM